MALRIDITEGAQLDHAVSGSTLIRIAHVTGLDAGAPTGDPSTLIRALAQAGLPQWFDLHPSNSTYILNRHVVDPFTDSSVKVTMYYVSGPAQPPAATWLVTENTTPYPAQTQIHPGTGDTMIVKFQSDPNDQATLHQNVATFAYDISLLRLEFAGWVNRGQVAGQTGPPNTSVFNQAVNSVNSQDWRGYPPGFWRFMDWQDTTADRGYSFTVKAVFGTKITEDWSQYEVYRDPANGKIIKPDPADVQSLRNQPYNFGWTPKNGITKAGNYRMLDFGPLFGTGN